MPSAGAAHAHPGGFKNIMEKQMIISVREGKQKDFPVQQADLGKGWIQPLGVGYQSQANRGQGFSDGE